MTLKKRILSTFLGFVVFCSSLFSGLPVKASGDNVKIDTSPDYYTYLELFEPVLHTSTGTVGGIAQPPIVNKIKAHTHYDANGNPAFCLSHNLDNPYFTPKDGKGQALYNRVKSSNLESLYSKEQIEKIKLIVQNSVLLFPTFQKDALGVNLPEGFRDLTFTEAQYCAQLAIWYVLSGTPGNDVWVKPNADPQKFEASNAWRLITYVLQDPYLKNPEGSRPGKKDYKGFFNYLKSLTKKPDDPTAFLQVQKGSVSGNTFVVPLKVRTTNATAGTVIEFGRLPEGSTLERASGTKLSLVAINPSTKQAALSGSVDETMTLKLPTGNNSKKPVNVWVYAKSNASDTNISYLVPTLSNFQNIIEVSNELPKSADNFGKLTLPTANGKLLFRKVDKDTGKGLSGFRFGIYRDSKASDFVQEVTTGQDGKAELTLPHGDYFLKELSVPSDYVLDATIHPYKVSDSSKEITIKNTRKAFSLLVVKKNADRTISLSGAVFGLYRDEAATDLILKQNNMLPFV